MLDEERFWSKVRRVPEGCWEWSDRKNHHGYGMLWDGKRSIRAHRMAIEFVYGPIPQEMVVMHKCDNPGCVRPSHLKIATQAENLLDMRSKGRGSKPPLLRGEKNNKAKLTVDQVREIRVSTEPERKLGPKYGVSGVVAGKIRRRQIWAWVE